MSIKGKSAIIGIGEVPTGKYPERDAITIAISSASMAIKDAGLKNADIDSIIVAIPVYSSGFSAELTLGRVAEELGIAGKVKSNFQMTSGGSSTCNMLKTATGMISLGSAQNVLCVHADKLATGLTGQEGIDLFAYSGISKEWEFAYGLNFSAIAGLITQRYMFDTGTTAEEMASVCVSNRKWAELNPNAMFRKPLTIEEVLSSKMLATPIHAKESNMLADGGGAFVITSAERAKDLTDRPVYVLGKGSRVTHYSVAEEPDLSRFAFDDAAQDAYREAGLTPKDMDIAEIYDSYAVFQLIGLEALGFCKRGEAGPYVLAGNTWPGRELPMTTNGGMLSQGHTGVGGGFALLIETARQLMGKAAERQVKDARFGVYTGTGGSYMDSQVTILGTEIP